MSESHDARLLGLPGSPTGVGRRDFLKWSMGAAGGALLTAGLAACGSAANTSGASAGKHAPGSVTKIALDDKLVAAAKKEGSLFLRYSTPLTTAQIFVKAFNKAYPGVNVQLDRKVGVVGTQAFESEQQAGKHIMDVNMSSDPAGLQADADKGYYLPYDVPELDPHIPSFARFGNFAYTYQMEQLCIQYNPSKISTADAVALFQKESWNGLLDPALKGKVGLTEPAGGGVPFGLYLMLYRTDKYGPSFLQKLGSHKPKLYDGSAPGREALASGDISVFATGWTQIAMQNFSTGDQTRWTYPSDMIPQFPVVYVAINKAAPHSNAAKLFVAWLLSLEGQKAMQLGDDTPIRKDVPDVRPALPKLKQTDWWKPFPSDIAYVPKLSDWVKNYSSLIPQMRSALGYSG